MIKVILFDLDDTLYNERDFVLSGFKEVAKYLSKKYSLESNNLYKDILDIFQERGRGKIFNILCEKYKLEEDIENLVDIYRNTIPNIKLYDDAFYMLENLKDKYKLGLVTDGKNTVQWNKIRALDIEKYMDKIIVTDDYGIDYWKPSEKPFMIMLEHFDGTPEEYIYIGDNPNKDFIGCKRLGINTIRIIREVGDHMSTFLDNEYEADFNIKSLLELENILKLLNKGEGIMKVLCIVQARMGSERLPGKVIKPILGKPMILYTLNRLKRSKYIDETVLATSTSEIEEPLVQIVRQGGYNIFRGEENNVLKRYVDAYKKFGGDVIVRVTGDCPLIDPQIVDNVISHYLMYDYDYVRLDVPDTFIRGFDVEVFTAEALERAYAEVSKSNEEQYKEHVTLYMYKNKDKFKIGYVKGDELYNKNYRLCVDTVEDFEVVNRVYEYYGDEYVEGKNIVKFLDRNIDLTKINVGVVQK